MKILDFRKYFFSYLYIVLGITVILSNIAADIFLEPAPTYITHEPMSPFVRNETFSIIFIGSSLLYICCCGALIVEILFRLILKKIFPNLKTSFKINMQGKVNKILSIIFYILFALASLPHLIFLINQLRFI